MSGSSVRPVSCALELTPSGRTALLLGLLGVALTAPSASPLALFPVGVLLAWATTAPVAWLALRALRVVPPAPRTVRAGAVFEFPLRVVHSGWAWGARDVLVFADADGPASSRPLAWLGRVAARSSVETPCEWRTRRRGRRTRIELRLTSTFPLGWWRSAARFEVPLEWLSLPQAARLGFEDERREASVRERAHAPSGGRGDDEFYALRDARSGDSPHWVHWRSTAKRGKLVVRELRGEERPEKRIALLGWTDRPLQASGTNEPFERAVSLAAALVERHGRRGEAIEVRFEGPSPWRLRVLPTRGAVQTLLARLAVVECAPLAPDRAAARSALERCAREGATLVHACARVEGSWRALSGGAGGARIEVPERRFARSAGAARIP